jgi:hypothetical protein
MFDRWMDDYGDDGRCIWVFFFGLDRNLPGFGNERWFIA